MHTSALQLCCFINLSYAVAMLPLGLHQRLVEQLGAHAAKWKEIGTYLGFRQTELTLIQNSPMHLMGAPGSWLSAMLEAWLQWKPGDSRRSSESASLESLKKAVSKAGLGRTAAELHY